MQMQLAKRSLIKKNNNLSKVYKAWTRPKKINKPVAKNRLEKVLGLE